MFSPRAAGAQGGRREERRSPDADAGRLAYLLVVVMTPRVPDTESPGENWKAQLWQRPQGSCMRRGSSRQEVPRDASLRPQWGRALGGPSKTSDLGASRQRGAGAEEPLAESPPEGLPLEQEPGHTGLPTTAARDTVPGKSP